MSRIAAIACAGALLLLLGSVFLGSQVTVVVAIAAAACAIVVAVRIVHKQVSEGRSRGAGVSGWAARSLGPISFQWRAIAGRGGRLAQPGQLSVRVRAPLSVELEFAREGAFDRLGKALGIAREFQTGDTEFDATCYIRGDVDSDVAAILRRDEMRTAIVTLFAHDCSSVRLSGRWLQADWRVDDAHSPALPDEAAVAALGAIASLLPARSLRSGVVRRQFAGSMLWCFSIVLGLAFVLGWNYPVVRSGQLWLLVLPIALCLWLALAWVAAWVMRGHSRSHDRWGLLMQISALTCVLGCHGAISHYNGANDPSPAVARSAAVADVWRGGRKGHWWRHVAVEDWSEPGEAIRFHIDRSQSRAVKIGATRVATSTHVGRLGIEWYQGFELVTP